jgi:ABC-type transport system involved in multi-copper enzyme maturation permease subunit
VWGVGTRAAAPIPTPRLPISSSLGARASFLPNFEFGLLLALAQVLAFLPWALALASESFSMAKQAASPTIGRFLLFGWFAFVPYLVLSVLESVGGTAGRLVPAVRQKSLRQQLLIFLSAVAGVVILLGLVIALLLPLIQEKNSLERWGRLYGSVLQIQLVFDLFVIIFVVLLHAWPKGGAVAIAAFREAIRQPMFWLFLLVALALMFAFILLPYFTFGEDLLMMTEIDYDIIMALAVIFGVFTASISISDEIEGRTAITLMSKPLSRRQFLLGKYGGILLACLMMTLLLGWLFNWAILGKMWFEKFEYDPNKEAPPAQLTAWLEAATSPGEARDFLRGVGLWLFQTAKLLPGMTLGFCQVMVLLAIAVSLATRLPMILNVPICLLIYFLGHLTPVLKQVAARFQTGEGGGSAVGQMLSFMAQLFNSLLPGLEYFTPNYSALVGRIVFYGIMYTIIALLFGLILFEDRDLA